MSLVAAADLPAGQVSGVTPLPAVASARRRLVALGEDKVRVMQQPEARGFRGSGSLLAGNPTVDRGRGRTCGRVRGIQTGVSMQGTGVLRRRGGWL